MKYQVNAVVTISIFTEVEAETPEEAMEEAEERSMIGLCHQCGGSRSSGEEWVTSGELDGMPQDLTVEETGDEEE